MTTYWTDQRDDVAMREAPQALASVYLLTLMLALVNGLPEYLFSVGIIGDGAGDLKEGWQELVRQVLWVKVLKDVALGLFLVFFLGVVASRALRGGAGLRIPRGGLALAFFAIFFVTWAALSTYFQGSNGLILSLAGLRALSAASIAFVWMFVPSGRKLRQSLGGVVIGLGVATSLLGLLQSSVSQLDLFWGRNLGIRVFSTLSVPSTFAVFLSIALYFALFEMSHRWRVPIILLFGANIVMTGSGMGVGAASFLVVGYLTGKAKSLPTRGLLVLFSFGAVVATATQLRTITGRDRIFYSFAERIQVLVTAFGELDPLEFLVGAGLGVGTNIARTLTFTHLPSLSDLVSDSTVTSLVVQVGVLGASLFYVPVTALVLRLFREGDPLAWLISMIVLVSLVTNVFELFPVNWIFFGACGMATHRFGRANVVAPIPWGRDQRTGGRPPHTPEAPSASPSTAL
jgi:hypothetical protein